MGGLKKWKGLECSSTNHIEMLIGFSTLKSFSTTLP